MARVRQAPGTSGSAASAAGPAPPPPGTRRAWRAAGLVLLLVAAMLLGRELGGQVVRFATWVERLGGWGPALFIAGYAVATVAFVPGSLLTLAAGVLFGVRAGTAYVFAGATLGSAAAFLIARHLARTRFERRVARDPRFLAVSRAIAEDGARIVLLLRLSPVFPYNLLNYALGLTRVRFADYLLASVGMLPGIVLYTYSGRVIGDLARLAAGAPVERGVGAYALLTLGLAATAAATVLIARRARRVLREATRP